MNPDNDNQEKLPDQIAKAQRMVLEWMVKHQR